MEDSQKQTPAAPQIGGENGERVFCGKFASAGELEKAYDSLQSAFTRKCQRSAELERKLEALERAQAGSGTAGTETQGAAGGGKPATSEQSGYAAPPDGGEGNHAVKISREGDARTRSDGAVGRDEAEDVFSDAELVERRVLSDRGLRERIIRGLLSELANNRPPATIADRGRMNIVPPKRPSSISEAGALVKGMLENGRI